MEVEDQSQQLIENEVNDESQNQSQQLVEKEGNDVSQEDVLLKENKPQENMQLIENKDDESQDDVLKDDLVKHGGPKNQTYQCDKCEYSTARRHDLTRHLVKHRGPKNQTYQCDKCEYKTARRHDLTRHNQSHTEGKLYKCEYCDYSTARCTDLKRHIIVHYAEKNVEYNCPYCDYSTKLCHQMLIHKKKHGLSKNHTYQCDKCEYSTPRGPATLIHHKRIHSDEYIASHYKEPYKCSVCDFETKDLRHLRSHAKTHVIPLISLTCEECDYTTYRKPDLKRHKRAHILAKRRSDRKQLLRDDGNELFECEECDLPFVSQITLIKHSHSIAHIRKTKYVLRLDETSCALKKLFHNCVECAFFSDSKSLLVRHLRSGDHRDHKTKSVTTTTRSGWKPAPDKSVTTTEKLHYHNCEKCGYSTKLKSDFLRHSSTHIGKIKSDPKTRVLEKLLHKCEECDYSANTPSELIRHLITHNRKRKSDPKLDTQSKAVKKLHTEAQKELLHKCKECDYSANTPSELIRHLITHNRKRKSGPKLDAQSNAVKKLHTEAQKELLVHECEECDYSAETPSELIRHLITHNRKK